MLQLIKEQVQLPERYTVHEQARIARELLLARSIDLEKPIETPSQQAAVAAYGRELQGAIKEVHETRVSLSKPLLEAVAKLISLERDFCEPLIEKKEIHGRNITAYQQAENARVDAEEKQRANQIQQLAKVEAESSKVGTIQAELVAHNAMEARQELIRAPLPELAKAKGAVTKQKLGYKVIDVRALYAARPELCKLEAKPSAILACCDPANPIDGIELWWETTTCFKA